MNYYEHHLGDYLRDTAHLSMLEDGAYRRLLDAYYIREAPLPVALRDVFRLVRAQSKQDREAVETVLREYFTETPEGWRHGRCDREIAAYAETIPDREARRENDRERQRRARERRKHLFDELRKLNLVPHYDAKTSELEALLSRATSRGVTEPVTRDNTATQTPDTRHQTPDKDTRTATAEAVARVREPTDDPPPGEPSAAGRVCRLMRAEGIADTNPGHPDLLALLDAGASDAECIGAAQAAVSRGKGFAYAVGTLKRQRVEAAELARKAHRGELPQPPEPAWRTEQRERVAAFAGPYAAKPRAVSATETVEVINAAARLVG